MVSFDTNVLVYAADRTAGLRHIASVNLLAGAASANAVLNEQSLIEFLNVSIRKQKRPLSEVSKMIDAWLKTFGLMTAPPTIVDDTLALLKSHALEVWDAHMLATCSAYGCDVLLSEDMTDGQLYGGVRVLNPFNPANAARVAEALVP